MKIIDPGLLLYADAFKIPRLLSIPMINIFENWIKDNGEEWTVGRMKSIKLIFIQLKAGIEPTHPWIRFQNGSLTGPFKGIQKWCFSNRRNWSKTISLLQIYTTRISTKLTPSQERKFLDGVNSEPIPIPESFINGCIKSSKILGIVNRSIPDPRPIALEPFSHEKFSPHASGRSFPESESVLESLSYTRQTRFGWDMRSRYAKIFDCVEEGIDANDHRDADVVDYTNSVGKIGFIQEPGFKLRAIANPGRVYQQALKPLGSMLYDILEHLPWDCTHDQKKGFPFIQEALSNESYVHSVDLTGATDYFPLDLQLHVLRSITNRHDYINLFRDISRGEWLYRDTKIRWKKGQPLGLQPSFASFALCHGLLLFYLNGFKHNNAFFVLGDDVVILDSCLHASYISSMEQLGCPISGLKSISSNKLAEFAGKLITSSSVVNQLKWRDVSDDSFIDILRNVGPQALFLLKKRQRVIAKLLWEVPDFLGGLGFNPRGIPLSDRVYNALQILDRRVNKSYLLGYTRLANHRNYYEKSAFPSPMVYNIMEADFDKKSIALVLTYLPTLIKWYEISGGNLYDINPNLRLVIDGCTSSRSSLLVKLERFFKQ